MTSFVCSLTLLLQLASAHFSVKYPTWRGDSFSTQWNRPCGGVNVTNNRTQWPLDGGSVLFSPSHPWAITYVNLGLGSDDKVIFNISLVSGFNQTGNGTFCFPKIQIPPSLNFAAGTNASLQVIQLSELGSALYNCADITLSKDTKLLSTERCANSSGINWKPLGAATRGPSNTTKKGVGSMPIIDKSVMNMWLGGVVAFWLWNW
ncbi:hypothetical protein PAAG_08312 [Paracoccidioides lutzii Pb01]|uniref:Copper acquisition factor BIM1-like domain-containing protein n=1 Tax=Paracoccidioides lutzii (strain ATCC MYA-826 / Pb01) TaxID=502779 RepID=C1HC21_PARBA|nr:hypothetical protein PAAG_08312 [Paracoccidioides lutzii Pb01]EEH38585.1 hypothetical protein PAAG_08312 [Paracoccidioides lutzii Pb01]